MVRRSLVIIAVIIAIQPVTADLSPEQRAQQEELLQWAETLRYQARVEQAMGVCEMIFETDPGCVQARIEHGVMALSAGRYDEAKEDFREALKREGGNPMALVCRAHVHHAVGDFDRADRDALKALQRCERLIRAEKADADTYYASGLAKLLQEDPGALQDFVMAVSLDPGHMDAHTERAHVYRAQGRTQDAIDQLTRAVEIRPDYAVGYLARARVQFEAGNLEESLADCDRALEINPGYARAWHNRGLVNMQFGDFEAAIGDLSEAISIDPDYASAHVYRGQAFLAAENEPAARADWERAAALEPEGWAGEAAGKMLRELGVSGG